MQNLFEEVGSLDRRCYERYGLSEDLLMEHAADGMADYIRQHYREGSVVSIVCGAGNNGADGVALSRLLHGDYMVSIYLPLGTKSPLSVLQLKRAQAIGVKEAEGIEACDILVDALFGSGFNRTFDAETVRVIEEMNGVDAVKIACDMPTGLHLDGTMTSHTFRAECTLTMGALKRGLFSDGAKELTGSIEVLDLGVSREVYEKDSPWKRLDQSDMKLPYRYEKSSHKGSYGHLAVVCGEKKGAAVLSGSAALRFGAGLVTLISNREEQIPYVLMQSHLLPESTTAMALGMGLGREFSHEELERLLNHNLPLLLDADIFTHPLLLELLSRKNIVITPHPKEFVSVLKACGLADISVAHLQERRFEYVTRFCEKFPSVTLVLKGANVIIGKDKTFYINPLGNNALAKGGSGDVLAGLIAALMAQGYAPLEAAIQGSLAHTSAATSFEKNSYALTPQDLIEAVTTL